MTRNFVNLRSNTALLLLFHFYYTCKFQILIYHFKMPQFEYESPQSVFQQTRNGKYFAYGCFSFCLILCNLGILNILCIKLKDKHFLHTWGSHVWKLAKVCLYTQIICSVLESTQITGNILLHKAYFVHSYLYFKLKDVHLTCNV